MTLLAQQLLSFSFAFPPLRALHLGSPLKAYPSSKCFVYSHCPSQFQTWWPRSRPAAHPAHSFFEEQESEGSDYGDEAVGCLGEPATHGTWEDTDDEGSWLGPTRCGASEDEDEDGGEEVGHWDPPVSRFRPQREEPYQAEEDDDEECEWLDPTSFLRCQEVVSGVCSTTAAMDEILAFARCSAAAGEQGFAEFMAGYSHGNLSEEECIELMWRMSNEGLALGCAHLFQWLREKQPVPVSSMVWLMAFVSLGRCDMADVVLEIVARLPLERDFREVVLYNAAISAVAYCRR